MLERLSGPNARPVALLVRQGSASAMRVNAEYRDFANSRVEEIGRLMEGLTAVAPLSNWRDLYVAVQDLRSSSATCDNPLLSRIACSCERALDWQYRREAKLPAVLALHLDALRFAVCGSASNAQLEELAGRLESVVVGLNPTLVTQPD